MLNRVNESAEEFVRDSLEIVSKAKERGIHLRILGAMACYLHLRELDPTALQLYVSLGRLSSDETFTDLDVIGYKKQRVDIMKLFEDELHLTTDRRFNAAFGNERLLYYKDSRFSIDVFLDALRYSHDVDFKNRLELDYPTVTVTDFLLEKLQIHEINRKDLIDLVATFLYYPVRYGSTGREIDVDYVSSVLGSDWGFWYDASSNMKKTSQMSEVLKGEGKLTEAQSTRVTSQLTELCDRVENAEKSEKWKSRAKVGIKKPWYRNVEEIVR